VSRALDLEPESSQLKAMHPLDNRIATAAGTRAMVVRRDDIGAAGFDLLLQNASAGAVADALRLAGAVDVDREAVEVVRVEAGRPVFHQDMDEATIPLEAGIEDRAISLTKGCYVGQEIIIRVLHRGQGRVARHLTGLALEPSAGVPAHGDRIRSGDREIGTVTSAVRSVLLQRPLALGYVHRDFVEPSTAVTIVSGGIGLPAIVTALPLSGAE
jgi:folate-binding protein YgfZ